MRLHARLCRFLLIALILTVTFPAAPGVTYRPALAQSATIALNPGVVYQTLTGWEATAQAGQLGCDWTTRTGNPKTCPAFQHYKDALFDQLVNDLGVNRLRLETVSAVENTTDYFTQFLNGQITADAWVKTYAPQSVNDNADPNVINPAGFQWSSLDHTVETVVLPIRQRLQARGEQLFLNVCYVGFHQGTTGFLLYANPPEYAEFVLATYQHLQSKYGLVPDTWEVELEPDNTAFDGTHIGQAIQATAARLQAAGYTPHFVVPSTTNMSNAQPYFNAIKAVIGDAGVRQYVKELSYHRYGGVSDSVLQSIGTTAQGYGIGGAMLEHIGSDYADLQKDLTLGYNTGWSQYTIAAPYAWGTADDGGKYYLVNDTNPNAPVIIMGSRTKFLRQYFKYVRAGARRIGATGNATFDPLAFVNTDGRYVVLVKATAAGPFSIQGLPAGTYGIKYTTAAAYDADLPGITIPTGQHLDTSIPATGVLTIYMTRQWIYLPVRVRLH